MESCVASPPLHTPSLLLTLPLTLQDSDVILFGNPYHYFKSPPFSNFTVINQAEVLFNESGYEVGGLGSMSQDLR